MTPLRHHLIRKIINELRTLYHTPQISRNASNQPTKHPKKEKKRKKTSTYPTRTARLINPHRLIRKRPIQLIRVKLLHDGGVVLQVDGINGAVFAAGGF